jgi:hypothetical protein
MEIFALCEVIDLLAEALAHHFLTIKSISFLLIKMLICSEIPFLQTLQQSSVILKL